MFTYVAPTFEGEYYRIEHADNRPRPVRAGGIPILIGGGEDDAVLGLVARYGDAVTIGGNLESVRESLTTLDRLCDEVGRDQAAISRIGVGMLAIAPTENEAAHRLDRRPSATVGPGARATPWWGRPTRSPIRSASYSTWESTGWCSPWPMPTSSTSSSWPGGRCALCSSELPGLPSPVTVSGLSAFAGESLQLAARSYRQPLSVGCITM